MDKWINEKNAAFLVFVFTIIGYGMAFFYEQGYLSYYKIDWNFVRISPLQIVMGVGVALAFATIFDFLTTTISGISKEYDRNKPLHRAKLIFWMVTLLAIGLIVITYIFTTKKSEFGRVLLAYIIGYLLVILAIFGDPISRNFKLRNWEEALRLSYKDYDEKVEKKRLEEQEKQKKYSKNTSSFTLSFNVVKDFFKPAIVIVLMFWAASIFGHQYNTGYSNKYVTVVKSDSTIKQIVIRQYSDSVLVIRYDTKSMKREDGFEVSDLKGKQYVQYVVECTQGFKDKKQKNTQEERVSKDCP